MRGGNLVFDFAEERLKPTNLHQSDKGVKIKIPFFLSSEKCSDIILIFHPKFLNAFASL